MARLHNLLFGLVLGSSLAVACEKNDDDHGDDHASEESGTHETGSGFCADLGVMCHEADNGMGMEMECHEVGHGGDEVACEAIYDECIALCTGATSGATTGADSTGGSGSGSGG